MDEINISSAKKLLKKAKEISLENQKIQNEKRAQGKFFNIFDVLNLRTEEVRTHSAFLAELLNPNGNHGAKEKFLNEFVKVLCNQKIIDPELKLDCKTATVKIEKYIGHVDYDSAEGGRLDILITFSNPKYAIIIENKIYADDQPAQLLRYKKFADKQYAKNQTILYLTLEGQDPSEKSTGLKEYVENSFWQNISYASDIKKWLEECVELSENQPLVQQTILQYINLINNLTNQEMDEKMSKEIQDLLLNGDNLRVAEDLSNEIADAKERIIQEKLVPKLRALAKKKKLEFDFDEIYSNKNYTGFWFYRKTWKEHFSIFFEFTKECSSLVYGINIEQEKNKRLYERLKKLGSGRKPNKYWAILYDFEEPYYNWTADTFIRINQNPDELVSRIEEKLDELLDIIKQVENDKK